MKVASHTVIREMMTGTEIHLIDAPVRSASDRTKTKGPARIALDAETGRRAGCLALRRARSTGTLVGLYKSAEAGFDDNEGTAPYTTTCEEHNTLVTHATRADAKRHMSEPEGWCDACRGEPDESNEET